MDTGIIYFKTEKGESEIGSRTFGLPANLRRVLILVDGLSSVQKIMEKGAGMQDIAQTLAELERQGFIRPKERYPAAQIKDELIRTARLILGENAEKIVGKIKDAPDTAEGLEQTVANCKKLVKLAIDETKADELSKKCSEILKRYKL